ncbi:MAG: outer membrane beta-barrel protein, partial [Bacteroidales bacterium]|nr:outer membrane beta-barrel protein [Bacteroidales bacterium]
MKKLALFLLALIFCTVAFNQESKVSVGIEFSPGLRWLYGNMLSSERNLGIGYSGGLNVQYHIKNGFSLSTGLTFDRKGTVTEMVFRDMEGADMGVADYKMNYDYLVLPLWGTIANKKDNFYFTTGPYVGYLLRYMTKVELEDPHFVYESNNTKDSKRFDFGWTFGLGFKIAMGSNLKLNLGVRDNLGLVNLSENDDTMKNNTLGFVAGFSYRLN